MNKMLIAAVAACVTGIANAATYELPDPAIVVNPNYSGNTTIVTVQGKVFRGRSEFYYLSECATPDTAKRHCNVYQEDDVTLTAADGSTVQVTITYQHLAVLITSGHNYWRQSDTVLAGTVTL